MILIIIIIIIIGWSISAVLWVRPDLFYSTVSWTAILVNSPPSHIFADFSAIGCFILGKIQECRNFRSAPLAQKPWLEPA